MTIQWWEAFMLTALALGALIALVFRAFEWGLKKAAEPWPEEEENGANTPERMALVEAAVKAGREAGRRTPIDRPASKRGFSRAKKDSRSRLLGGRTTLIGSNSRWYDRWDEPFDASDMKDPANLVGVKTLNDLTASVERLEEAVRNGARPYRARRQQ